MCGAPAVVNMVLDAADRVGRADPRTRSRAHRRRRRAAADAHDRAGRDRARLGVRPDLRAHRDVAAADDEPQPRRVRRPRSAERAAKLNRAGGPAIGCRDARRRAGRGARPQQRRDGRLLGPARGDGRGRSSTAGSTPATAASIDDDNYVTISDRKKDVIISGGENVSSIEVEDAIFQHPDVTEVAVIGIPDEKWGELVTALVVTATRQRAHRRRRDRLDASSAWPGTSARSGSSSATSSPAPPPASCRSSSSANPSGPATRAK